MLLADTVSNGARGVRAIEDRGRFGIGFRIATSAETLVVPRLDPAYRSGDHVPPGALRADSQPVPQRPAERSAGPIPVSVGRAHRAHPAARRRRAGHRPCPVRPGAAEVTSPERRKPAQRWPAADGYPRAVDAGPRLPGPVRPGRAPRDHAHRQRRGRLGQRLERRGTYEVHVARTLALDTAVLPGTPFEVGDTLSAGRRREPAGAGRRRGPLAPGPRLARSGHDRARGRSGRANRFGYFKPSDGAVSTSTRPASTGSTCGRRSAMRQGTLWMGTRTWGGVVAPRDPASSPTAGAASRRSSQIGNQWYFRSRSPLPGSRGTCPFPFHSGDVQWAQRDRFDVPHGDRSGSERRAGDAVRARTVAPTILSLPALAARHVRRSGRGRGTAAGVGPARRPRSCTSIPEGSTCGATAIVRSSGPSSACGRRSPRTRSRACTGFSTTGTWSRSAWAATGDLPNDFKFMYGAAVLARRRGGPAPVRAVWVPVRAAAATVSPSAAAGRSRRSKATEAARRAGRS